MNQAKTIRLPIHIAKELNTYLRAQRELSQKLDHEPTADDVAKLLGRPVEDVRHLLDLADDISCTEISTLEPERGAWDTFEDDAAIDPSQMLQNNRLKARIDVWLGDLPEKVARRRVPSFRTARPRHGHARRSRRAKSA